RWFAYKVSAAPALKARNWRAVIIMGRYPGSFLLYFPERLHFFGYWWQDTKSFARIISMATRFTIVPIHSCWPILLQKSSSFLGYLARCIATYQAFWVCWL